MFHRWLMPDDHAPLPVLRLSRKAWTFPTVLDALDLCRKHKFLSYPERLSEELNIPVLYCYLLSRRVGATWPTPW